MEMYKGQNGITCVCDNCGRSFKAELPPHIMRKIRTAKDLKEDMFPDEKYNIRYLIRYDLCWKCRKDPEGMRREREFREECAERSRHEKFKNWLDSMD